MAVDIRRHKKGQHVTSDLVGKLGDDYDVVLESTHIHIEYDPK